MIRWLGRMVMPSVTLGRYVTRLFLIRFIGLLLGLTIILQMLDLLAVSDDIMAADGATQASLLRYIGMRFPQLVSQFIPFVALLASLLTLATLNQHSEIAVLGAVGLSPHRILFPLGLASALIAGGHFAFHEMVVIDANRELDGWRGADYAPGFVARQNPPTSVYVSQGDQLIHITAVSFVRGQVVLDGITVYERDADGRFTHAERADFAYYSGGRWTLHNSRRLNFEAYTTAQVDSRSWDLTIPPERFLTLTIKAEHEPLVPLYDSIEDLEMEGLPTDRLRSAFMKRFSAPLASLIMPLLGAVTAFGSRRSSGLAMRLSIGIALGFAFFVADNFMIAMGKFGVIPPFLAAWAPLMLFLILGYAVLIGFQEGRWWQIRTAT